MFESPPGSGNFKTDQNQNLRKNVYLLGEIHENVYLVYSYVEHSFARWNAKTGQFKTVNLISRGSNFHRNATS